MTKVFLPLCFLLLSVTGFAQSPITLTRADFPRPTASSSLPDSVLYTNVLAPTGNAQDVNGANQTWDVSYFTGNTAYQNYIPMSATPLVFQLAFLTCDFAQPLVNAGGLIGGGAGLGIADAYEYYNYSTGDTRLEIKGFGATITPPGTTTGIPTPALYSPADVVYRFPINFGNVDSSNSAYDISIPLGSFGNVGLKRKQKRVNNVDAWGSIITPAGTFDVLRVVADIQRVDSIISSITSLGIPSNTLEIKWLGQGKKLPVLQINATKTGTTITPTTATFWGQGAAAVDNEPYLSTDMNLFPNPCIDQTTVSFELTQAADVDIMITNLQGQKCGEFHFRKSQAGTYHEVLPLQRLPNGVYQVQCKVGGKVLAGQLLVTKS